MKSDFKLKFKLWIDQNLINYSESKTIGFIYNEPMIIDNVIMFIIISEKYLQNSKMRECAVNYGTNTRKPAMFISLNFAKRLKEKNPTALFMLYHELGHIVLGHNKRQENLTNETITAQRIESVKNHTVIDVELQADAFATKICGKKNALKALKEIKNMRKMDDLMKGNANHPISLLALREYDYRIETINLIK